MTKEQSNRFRSDMTLVAASVIAGMALSRHLSRTAFRVDGVEVADAQMPPRTWKDILVRTWHQIDEDRLLATAGGVVFFGLLATFPAITALVSSYGLFAEPATIAAHLQSLAVMLPAGSFAIVQDQIDRVVAHGASLGVALSSVWCLRSGAQTPE